MPTNGLFCTTLRSDENAASRATVHPKETCSHFHGLSSLREREGNNHITQPGLETAMPASRDNHILSSITMLECHRGSCRRRGDFVTPKLFA